LRGGGQTYILNLLDNMSAMEINVLLLINTKNNAVFSNYKSVQVNSYEAAWASKSILHRVFWEIFCLPIKLNSWHATVYYAPGGIMITKVPKGCLSATALQNMLPFDVRERKRFPFFSYIRFKLWLLRYVFLISYKLSDKVVFISEYSRSVIEQYIPDIGKKSIVIPHGLNSDFLNTADFYDLPDFLKETPFYLYVSILDVYKAQKEVIQSWKLLADRDFPYPLVLVGPKYNQYGEEVIALIDELGLSKKVIYLGAVAYEKLPGLYKSARALIFASSCECCPNILLEKLAAGKSVLCSNIEPMPEFGADAVVYFDPYNKLDLVEKIIDLEKYPNKMNELADKAHAQAMKFDWKSTTERTVRFLLNNKSIEG
ncbi:MAG: glycosyltransferase family 1 protein, partial [Methylococcales bacterium]